MTSPINPATPLPWINSSHPESDYAEIQGPLEGIAAQSSHADAAYIVHACNAYPKLVEALLACCAAIEASEAYDMEHNGTYDALPEPCREAAQSLLESLGETP